MPAPSGAAGTPCPEGRFLLDSAAMETQRTFDPGRPFRPRPDDGTLARIDALRILARWEETGEFPDRMLGDVPAFRRGFVMDLVYTTVRNARALAFAVDGLVRTRPEHPHAYAALLLGAAQILLMPDVAQHAEVHATVEALKALDGPSPAGFVNAVLRNLLRHEPAIRASLAAAPLAVRESHVDEQVARWTARWGEARAEAICKWDNRPASVTLVPVPGRATAPEILAAISASGVRAAPHPGLPSAAVVVPHGSRVDLLPGFREGMFAIQDPATLEAVRLLDVRPGQRVLDACAAPGGKTVQIAARLRGEGALVATDCWRDRLNPLRENLERFGFDGFVRVAVADAKRVSPRDLAAGPFDRILADVPCSNTGVQRRRADARWRFDPARLATLAETQLAILENLAMRHLVPGGRLVYSTCSIEEEENERVVAEFVRRHPEFRVAAQTLQVPPDRECDGAFAAALERKA